MHIYLPLVDAFWHGTHEQVRQVGVGGGLQVHTLLALLAFPRRQLGTLELLRALQPPRPRDLIRSRIRYISR